VLPSGAGTGLLEILQPAAIQYALKVSDAGQNPYEIADIETINIASMKKARPRSLTSSLSAPPMAPQVQALRQPVCSSAAVVNSQHRFCEYHVATVNDSRRSGQGCWQLMTSNEATPDLYRLWQVQLLRSWLVWKGME
jgi:hypothetical protein